MQSSETRTREALPSSPPPPKPEEICLKFLMPTTSTTTIGETAKTQSEATSEPVDENFVIWNPSIENLDRNVQYLVRVDDFDFDVSPYTVFAKNGMYVIMSGNRLKSLFNLNKRVNPFVTKFKENTNSSKRKSLKNVCFKMYLSSKKAVIDAIANNVELPECMSRNLRLLKVQCRGNRHSIRFVFNSYVRTVFGCTKCDKRCIRNMLAVIYDHDDKCVREIDYIFDGDFVTPNCAKMKDKYSLCHRTNKCKGTNPIHNF
ncbi:LEF-2 [Spodoptera littoralis nucleopolyhedrovirus]|uniref:LEF-2 n=1 Tax=Spodoptera littoralis nuclear polyhedrosis virus TaxID=10456 RepID=M1JTJ2_NPVSL|nr:LEF-2 [Spodoptera littoralis nucleopolyhedrovirus]AGE89965.1 LEF-2 [Spodoptera littoralis nucleopolyhedrovirus]